MDFPQAQPPCSWQLCQPTDASPLSSTSKVPGSFSKNCRTLALQSVRANTMMEALQSLGSSIEDVSAQRSPRHDPTSRISMSASLIRQSPAIVRAPESHTRSVSASITEGSNSVLNGHSTSPHITDERCDAPISRPSSLKKSINNDKGDQEAAASDFLAGRQPDISTHPSQFLSDNTVSVIQGSRISSRSSSHYKDESFTRPDLAPYLFSSWGADQRYEEEHEQLPNTREMDAPSAQTPCDEIHPWPLNRYRTQQRNTIPSTPPVLNGQLRNINGSVENFYLFTPKDRSVSPQNLHKRCSEVLLSQQPVMLQQPSLLISQTGLPGSIGRPDVIGLGIHPDTWKTSNSTPVHAGLQMYQQASIRALSSPPGLTCWQSQEGAPISSERSNKSYQAQDQSASPAIQMSVHLPKVLRRSAGNADLGAHIMRPASSHRRYVELTIFVRRRALPHGVHVSSIYISHDLTNPPNIESKEDDRAKSLVFDDVSFFRNLRRVYYSVLIRSSASSSRFERLWRRWASAKRLSGLAVVPSPRQYTGDEEDDDTFSEDDLFRYFQQPSKCRPGKSWVRWAYKLASEEPRHRDQEKSHNEDSSEQSFSNETDQAMPGAKEQHLTPKTTTINIFVPGEIEFVETWSVRRITSAVMLVILASLLVLLLCLFFGPTTFLNAVIDGSTVSSDGGAGSRVGFAAVLAILVLLLGSVVVLAWLGISWLLM